MYQKSTCKKREMEIVLVSERVRKRERRRKIVYVCVSKREIVTRR
jgi:hypothetical protein